MCYGSVQHIVVLELVLCARQWAVGVSLMDCLAWLRNTL